MDVIAHHGKAEHIEPELTRQELHAVLDPLLAVLVAFSGRLIGAAEE
jgi:hypothetical protein